MASKTWQSIVQATQRDVDQLARLIHGSFADVARRFDLTPGNCPRHPLNCTREWAEADLEHFYEVLGFVEGQNPNLSPPALCSGVYAYSGVIRGRKRNSQCSCWKGCQPR